MEVVGLAFEGRDDAQSARIARELRRNLIAAGVPPDHLKLRQENPEAQGGEIVEIIKMVLDYGSMAAETAVIAKTVYELVFKERCPLTIKTAKGAVIKIGAGEIELESLRALFLESLTTAAPEPAAAPARKRANAKSK